MLKLFVLIPILLLGGCAYDLCSYEKCGAAQFHPGAAYQSPGDDGGASAAAADAAAAAAATAPAGPAGGEGTAGPQ